SDLRGENGLHFVLFEFLCGKELLFRQPFLPVPGELVGGLLGYWNQRTHVLQSSRVFLEVNLVDEVFDGAVTPFIDLLGQQQLNVATAEIGQLRRQGVHRNAFHGAGLPFQGIVGEQRPTPNHRPTGDVGIGLHDLLDLGGRVLWRLLVVVNVADGDARVFLRGVLHALNTLLQVRRVLVAGQNRNDTFAAHVFGQLVHHLFDEFHIFDGLGYVKFDVLRVVYEVVARHAVNE